MTSCSWIRNRSTHCMASFPVISRGRDVAALPGSNYHHPQAPLGPGLAEGKNRTKASND